MIRLFNKLQTLFYKVLHGYDKDKSPQIKLATSYVVSSNTYPYNISDNVLEDIKDQVYRRLKEDAKLLRRVNDFGIIDVGFVVNVPIGVSANVNHLFYWDGDTLYSMIKESKQMGRASAIDEILR